jgi:hypothetical protein
MALDDTAQHFDGPAAQEGEERGDRDQERRDERRPGQLLALAGER